MEFTDFMLLKAGALCALAFFGSMFYRLFTGRSLEQDLSDTPKEEQSSSHH